MQIVQIFNEASSPTGLPLNMSINVPATASAQQLLIVSGSGWSRASNQVIGVQILAQGVVVGQMQIFSNGVNTHRAFAPAYIPLTLTPGSTVAISLQDNENTPIITDGGDLFNAVLIC